MSSVGGIKWNAAEGKWDPPPPDSPSSISAALMGMQWDPHEGCWGRPTRYQPSLFAANGTDSGVGRVDGGGYGEFPDRLQLKAQVDSMKEELAAANAQIAAEKDKASAAEEANNLKRYGVGDLKDRGDCCLCLCKEGGGFGCTACGAQVCGGCTDSMFIQYFKQPTSDGMRCPCCPAPLEGQQSWQLFCQELPADLREKYLDALIGAKVQVEVEKREKAPRDKTSVSHQLNISWRGRSRDPTRRGGGNGRVSTE